MFSKPYLLPVQGNKDVESKWSAINNLSVWARTYGDHGETGQGRICLLTLENIRDQ